MLHALGLLGAGLRSGPKTFKLPRLLQVLEHRPYEDTSPSTNAESIVFSPWIRI